MFLTREESQEIKGIAILLMLFHHLFAFSDRIPNGLHYSNFTVTLAKFGNVCVPIFLFISGYGLAKTKKKTVNDFFNRIKDFYLRYWLVFVLFIPITFLVGKVEITPLSLFFNLTALKTSYNGEWWFVTLYIFLLLITPFLYKISSIKILLLTVTLSVFHFVGYRLLASNSFFIFVPNFTPILAFGIGFIVTRYETIVMERIDYFCKKFANIIGLLFLLFIFFFLLIIGARIPSSMSLICPAFILYFKYALSNKKHAKKFLRELGNRSMFMWLTHSFYCYKLIPSLIYSPRIALLVFLLLVFISYVTAMVLEKIYTKTMLLIPHLCNKNGR